MIEIAWKATEQGMPWMATFGGIALYTNGSLGEIPWVSCKVKCNWNVIAWIWNNIYLQFPLFKLKVVIIIFANRSLCEINLNFIGALKTIVSWFWYKFLTWGNSLNYKTIHKSESYWFTILVHLESGKFWTNNFCPIWN